MSTPPIEIHESPPSARVVLLDSMRSISILRVVLVHVFGRFEHPAFILLTFFFPGMPIVFAVSGALSYSALSKDADGARVRFWKSRARRLFFPFWTYASFAVVFMLAVQAGTAHAWYQVDSATLWRWAVPIVQPAASPGLMALAAHLWFVPPFVFLLATAPLLVAAHRRVPWLGVLVFVGIAIFVELDGIDLPNNLSTTLLFGIAFQCGFGITDGSLQKLGRPILVALFLLLLAAGLAWHHHVAPGQQVNAVPSAHVLVGLAYLPLWIAGREWVERAFHNRCLASASGSINRRAYTLFLWGPGATELAWRIAHHIPSSRLLPTYYAATAILLVAVVWIFGQVEDRAARRA